MTSPRLETAMLTLGRHILVDADDEPGDSGQFGVSLKYRPEGMDVDLGLYYQRFHDKTPTFNTGNANGAARMYFLEDRELYGISANTSVGNWAVGAELSQSAEDAVSLGACQDIGFGSPDQCDGSIDEERYQFHLTGIPQPDARRPRLVPRPDGRARPHLPLARRWRSPIRGEQQDKAYVRTRNGVTYQQLPAAGMWTHRQRRRRQAVLGLHVRLQPDLRQHLIRAGR